MLSKTNVKGRGIYVISNLNNMKLHFPLLLLLGVLTLSCNQKKKEISSHIEPQVIEKESQSFVYGVDISHFENDQIDFINKHKDSLSFIICKATEGITYTDPDFFQNWKMIKKSSLIRGAYHFYRSDDDPLVQAAHFFNTISDIESVDIPPIIDFEGGGIDKSQSVDEIQSALLTFLNEIENKSSRKPIIYTNITIGNEYLNIPAFAVYPLWIADYNGKKKPNLPITWKNKGWLIWQRTSKYGIDNTTDDFDIFNGSQLELKTFIKNSDNQK